MKLNHDIALDEKHTLTLGDVAAVKPEPDVWKALLLGIGAASKWSRTYNEYNEMWDLTVADIAACCGAWEAMRLSLIEDPMDIIKSIMPTVRRASAHTADVRVHQCIASIDRWIDHEDTDIAKASRESYAAYKDAGIDARMSRYYGEHDKAKSLSRGMCAAWAATYMAEIAEMSERHKWTVDEDDRRELVKKMAEKAADAIGAAADASPDEDAERVAQVADMAAIFGRRYGDVS